MRPSIPSQMSYWVWFGLAAILTFGMLGYLLWARSRGLLGWSELWAIEINFAIGGLFSSAINVAFRWRWLKKRDELRAYEQAISRPLEW